MKKQSFIGKYTIIIQNNKEKQVEMTGKTEMKINKIMANNYMQISQ